MTEINRLTIELLQAENKNLRDALEDAVHGINALRFYFEKYGDVGHPGMIRSMNSLIVINKALGCSEYSDDKEEK